MPRPLNHEEASKHFRTLPLSAEWLDSAFCEAPVIHEVASVSVALNDNEYLRWAIDAHNRLRLSAFHILRLTPRTRGDVAPPPTCMYACMQVIIWHPTRDRYSDLGVKLKGIRGRL